ncbi:MAG: bifunctional DNA primase/polymerase, partial [Phycisphaerae bacterium]|nr:bifunctional DNA primase/polymerase [Phycisphaerae bacterium]
MPSQPDMLRYAQAYLQAGLCVLPARRDQKRPTVSWRKYQQQLPTAMELEAWFANSPEAVCILCGQASGNLEIIDFDAGGELFDAWRAKVRQVAPGLIDKLTVQSTQSGGRHAVYRSASPICGSMKLAQRQSDDGKIVTLIETRGEGGLFLCAPTAGYEVIQGNLANAPVLTVAERDVLLQAAWELNEYLPPVVNGPTGLANVGQRGALSVGQGRFSAEISDNGGCRPENAHMCDCPSDNWLVGQRMPMSVGPRGSLADNADRPGDDFNLRGDVRAVLEQHGWVRVKGGRNEYWRRPGKESGTSATLKDRVFFVFSSNAAPFEPNRGYSPFAVYTLLNHGGDFEQAARSLGQHDFGSDSLADNAAGADISAIVRMSAAPGECPSDNAILGQTMAMCDGESAPASEIADPGPIPEHLFHVPGLVEQVMDFTLAKAPYPNVGLAFCGAMALQSYLCGRKVCDSGDLRPNLYLLALASSGTGKDFPRKVNSRVLFEIGHVAALGDKFASGEGIQDALARTSAMLFQNDEMDGVLRQINLDRENRRESIPNVLLTLYTSANDVYPMRVKAGQKEACHIDQPHLTLFGTATPQYFYESLSQRMLTNGFFARLIIVDVGKRGQGQRPGNVRKLPQSIIEAAHWWAEFQAGSSRANLLDVHPEPRVVSYTPEAEAAITAFQRQAEQEYDQAH